MWFKEVQGFNGEVVRYIAECRLCEIKRFEQEREKRKKITPPEKKPNWLQKLLGH